MQTITIYSKKEIAEIVNKELNRKLRWIYDEIEKLRLKLNDIEKLNGEKMKTKELKEHIHRFDTSGFICVDCGKIIYKTLKEKEK